MAVEPKKKKLRPNERFVWGPQPCSWPRGVFFDGNFWWGQKSLTKQWWTVAFFQLFFWGGMEMPNNCEQLEKVYFVFFPWWNSAGVDENPSQKKTMVEITLKVVSLTIAEIQMLKMFQCGWNEMTANVTPIFGANLIFTFHEDELHHSLLVKRWNLESGWLASASDPRHHHACPWRWWTKMPRPSRHRRSRHRRRRLRYRKRRRLDQIVERDWEGKIHQSTECVYKWMQAIIYLHISITYIIYTYRYEQKVYLWFSWQEVRCLTSFVFVDFGKNPVFSFVLWITWMKTSFKIGEVIYFAVLRCP